MILCYTGEEMPQSFSKSLMLCGPSLRPGQEKEMESWRKDALQILNDIGYDGVVFVPENRDGVHQEDFDYAKQVLWEEKHLNIADVIVFWVPRNIDKKLFGFTTNTEYGHWNISGKCVFGAPPDADKNEYLKYYADKYRIPTAETLTETLQNALDILKDGAARTEGERYVPLNIWRLESFQAWYKNMLKAGNHLEKAKVLFTFRPGFKDFIFLWILQAEVYIEAEKRSKTNEFVLARPDTSAVCLWYDNPAAESIFDKQVVLVREFRTPVNNKNGFVWELAGGSSPDPGDPEETAAAEVHEETGMYLDPIRLKFHTARQMNATLSAHRCHLFSAQINEKELDWLSAQAGIAHGKEEDTERTFIEIYTVNNLLKTNLVDWSVLGMILQVISE